MNKNRKNPFAGYSDFVTASEWSETHPANLKCASDAYYAELANDITDIIDDYQLPASAPDGLSRELGRVLAAYLEDIVSETKVFSAMRRVCMQRYGYRLPFFDCEHDDYMPDHLNEEDIRFLIWKTACQLAQDKGITYSPLAAGWELLTTRIFGELDARFEEAPEANRVADWMRRSFRKEEYIDVRETAMWLVLRNPLTYIPGFMDELKAESETAFTDDSFDIRNLSPLIYGIMATQSWQRSMSPMGCPSQTLAAAVAAEFGYDSLAADIEALKVLPKQIYAISQDRKSRKIFFENAAHERMEVKRDSIAKGFRPDEIQYAECILVEYKGNCLLNGLLLGDPALRKNWESQIPVLTYGQQHELARKWIETVDGRQVLCVTDIKDFMKKLDFPDMVDEKDMVAENYIILLSRELGLAVLPDTGYAFDLPDNRFYEKKEAAKDSFADLVFHNAMPHDVAMYIQDHHLLPEARIDASQGKETGLRIVQDYLAFWIGFYCNLPAYGDSPSLKPTDLPED